MNDMEYRVGQYQVTCPVRPSPQVRPLPTPYLRDLRDLLVTFAAIVIIINRYKQEPFSAFLSYR